MQIEATLRFHLTPVRIAIIKNTTNNICWWGSGKGNPNPLLVWMQAGTTTLEKIWTLLKNLNIDLPYDPAIPLFWDIPKGMQHRLLQRHLHTHVYCSTIYNCQVVETTKMPHYWWMNQENVVFIHNGILLSHEEEWNRIICR
jgi:hypothetical protein